MKLLAKRIFKNEDPNYISAVHHDLYAERFIHFMKDEVFKTPQKYQDKNEIEKMIKF
jgi:hypothetical protein